ncbi:MAG: extensin family protein [Pseudomonadota bacterium]
MTRMIILAACMALAGCGLGSRLLGGGGTDTETVSFAGSVCGDPMLKGEVIGAVPGRIPGCGIDEAVQITSVAGVGLSQPSLMDCPTAMALKDWTENSVKPAMSSLGRLASYRVAAHYVCKTRNSQPGAKISEHGKGRAIDISAFNMQDGTVVTVLTGWGDRRTGKALREVHKGACGPFGTVLGPDSDRFHQGHFHLDTARYRGGPYCR